MMQPVSAAEETPKTTTSIATLAVNAELRAELAARNLSQHEFAKLIGRSNTYVNERLNDRKTFTLEELDLICEWLGEDHPGTWLQKVIDRHSGHLNERLANEGFSIQITPELSNALHQHASDIFSLPKHELIKILEILTGKPALSTRAEPLEDDAP